MTAEEVAAAYGQALLAGLRAAATAIPADALLQTCLALQSELGALVKEPATQREAGLTLVALGDLARLASETIDAHRRQLAESTQKRFDELVRPSHGGEAR